MTQNPPFPRAAALVAGLGLLAMTALGPFGLFTVTAVTEASPEAAGGLVAAPRFLWAIAAFGAIALLDAAVAFGLHGVFRGSAPGWSRAALWLRLAYALALAALAVVLLRARAAPDGDSALALVAQFSRGWLLALGVFGLHLAALGAAGWGAPALPRLIAALVGLAGLGYLADALGTLFVAGYALNLAAFVFVGELLLMVWLLFRAVRPPR